MNELPHDGNDDLFLLFSVCLEAISKFFEQWIEDSSVHGGHKKGAP